MDKATDIGMNRTGAAMSPMKSKEAKEGAKKYSPDYENETNLMKEMRSKAIRDSEPVGTVPPPGKIKGAIKTGAQALKGNDAAVFIDKLGERLAFERTGVRLYEAVIQKCETLGLGKANFSIDTLKHYLNEEGQHFKMLVECLENLGADPTCMTPSADISAVAASGHLKVIADPRTSVADSVHSLLALELQDNDEWELLIELAEKMGETEMVKKFEKAYEEEAEHLKGIRQLYTELVKSEENLQMDVLQ